MGKGSVRLVKAGELGEGGVFEGVGLKGIGLPTLAVFLDLKYNRVKPYLVNRPWPKSSHLKTIEGGLRSARKLARRPTLLSLHLAFVKLQASPLPSRKATRSCICRRISLARSPQRSEKPRAAHCESPALLGGPLTPAADWRAAQPLRALARHRPFKKSSAGGRRCSSRRRRVHLRTVPVLRNPFPAGTSSSLYCS